MTAIRKVSPFFRLLCSLLVVLLMVALLSACDNVTVAPENPDTPGISDTLGDSDPDSTHLTIIENGKFNFTITYPKSADSIRLFTDFRDRLKSVTGIKNINMASDGKDGRPEYEILCGITETPETKSVLATVGYNNYIIKVVETKIVITSPSEYALEDAISEFINFVSENTKDGRLEIPLNYIAVGTKSHSKFTIVTDDIPSPIGFVSCQFSDCDDGYQQATLNGCTKSTYDEYKKTLTSAGFTEYAISNLGGTEYATYQKGEITVHTYFTMHNGQMRIIGAKNALLPSTEQVNYTKICEPTFTLMGLEKGGSNGGLGCIIGLPDGTFIIVDGGHKTSAESDDIANTLCKLSGKTKDIVIRAWVFTHAHSDHIGAFIAFSPTYADAGIFTIENFIFYGCDTEEQNQYSSSGSFLSTKNTINTYWPSANVYKCLTGQIFHFPGCDMEVLYTMSDFLPTIVGEEDMPDIDKNKVDGNIKTAVFRFFIEEQSVLVTGDTTKLNIDEMCARYGSYLKSDIMTVPHHGHNENRYRARNGTIEFYTLVDPSIVMWPDGEEKQKKKLEWNHVAGSDWEANYYLVNFLHVKEVIVAGKTTKTVTLPYHGPI